MEAYVDPDDFQHEAACDIISGWARPTLPVVRAPRSDPRWEVEHWRLEMPLTDDPFLKSMRTEMAKASAHERASDASQAMLVAVNDVTVFEVQDTAEEAQRPVLVDAADLAEPEPKSKSDKSQNESNQPAPAVPFAVSQEMEVMAARVLRYATRKAKSDSRLRSAGVEEDVAVNFALYALGQIQLGKYRETGKFYAWLKTRWHNYVSNQRDTIALEIGRFTGHMSPNDENPDAPVSRGYVSYDSATFKSFQAFGHMQVIPRRKKNGVEQPPRGIVMKEKDAESVLDDELTFILRRKLEALKPYLTDTQRKILTLRSEGGTYADIAAAMGMSARSVPRQIEAVKEQAVSA